MLHPPAPSQLSEVQLRPSSQLYGVPTQPFAPHESLNVQASPSSQVEVSAVQLEVLDVGSQMRHAFPGSVVPAPIQALPMTQNPGETVKVQPPAPSHASTVHAKPSLQVVLAPWHVPLLQLSTGEQLSPSSQVVPFGAIVHVSFELLGAQERHPCALVAPVWTQAPAMRQPVVTLVTQVLPIHWFVVQALPSLQSRLVLHGPDTKQPSTGWPLHAPAAQVSPLVHAFPSLQASPPAEFWYWQPVAVQLATWHCTAAHPPKPGQAIEPSLHWAPALSEVQVVRDCEGMHCSHGLLGL